MLRYSRVPLAVAALVLALPGCSSLPTAADEAPLATGATPPPGSASEFDAVASAAQRGAVVLSVPGAEPATRVIPLPPDGQPVYVSMLLKQSGLTKSYSRMQATLYRNSPEALGGIRMGVRFVPDTNTVAPEYDYMLRPGDRLVVVEEEVSPLDSLGGIFGSSNTRRALLGI